MRGLFLLVWLALAPLVRTKPVLEEGNYGGSNFYLNNEEDYYPYEEGDESYGKMQDYYDDIQTNKMCSHFVKQMTLSYKSSLGAQQSIVEPILVTKMEELIVYIQDKAAIAQRKQEAGEDFAYDPNDLKKLWDSISQSLGGPLRYVYKDMLQNYITTFGSTLNVFMEKEARARSELEEIISRGVDSLATYTQQKDWQNGEVSQFEEDADCFYDFMKSDLNYTAAGMTKEDFVNAARNLAHSLHVITTSHGIKTSITDIALDAANKLKTVNYEEIKNYLFEAIDIVSDENVQTVEILDKALQFGVWQMALGVPVPRLDDFILKAIEIVKSGNFWIKTEQLHWKTAIEYIKPVMLNMVDLVAELSNEVDIAYELEAVAATIEEAIGSVNIDGQEIADAIEQYIFTDIEEYLLVIENMGSLDQDELESLMPLLTYGVENTKLISNEEGTFADQDSLSFDDNGQEGPKELSTDGYEEIQEGSGSIADESVSKDLSVEFQEGSVSIPENNFSSDTSREGYGEIIEEDVSIIAEEQSSDDNNEIVEDVLIIEEEDSSDGHKKSVEEDVSVIAMEYNNSDIQAEEDYKDIVEENGNENIEIEEAYGFVYHA